jgi:hypothetical protein
MMIVILTGEPYQLLKSWYNVHSGAGCYVITGRVVANFGFPSIVVKTFTKLTILEIL